MKVSGQLHDPNQFTLGKNPLPLSRMLVGFQSLLENFVEGGKIILSLPGFEPRTV
jgi:hypothetical protein